MDIRTWLINLGMERYAEAFEEEGYEDLNFLSKLPREQLMDIAINEIGMHDAHAARLAELLPQQLQEAM